MKKFGWLIILSLGCSNDLRVYTDYDRAIDMHKFKTYQWAPQKDIEVKNNPIYYNELTDKRIKKITDGQLQIKGLTLVDKDPDITIHYHIVVDEEFLSTYDPYGMYGPYWVRPSGNLISYKEGTLIIDMMDPKTNNLIWRGYAVSVIEDSHEDITEDMLIKAITKIFEQYEKYS